MDTDWYPSRNSGWYTPPQPVERPLNEPGFENVATGQAIPAYRCTRAPPKVGHPVPAYVGMALAVVALVLAVFIGGAGVVNRCFALLYLFISGLLLIYLTGLFWFAGQKAASWLMLVLLVASQMAVLVPLGLSGD